MVAKRLMLGASLVLCLHLPAQAAEAEGGLGPGDKARPQLGVTLDGTTVDLAEGAGKVQVVTFWATWCAPCLKEIPVLEGLQRTVKDRLRVVAVNIEDRAQFRKALRAFENSKFTLTLAHDYNKASSTAYGVKGIPHMVIVGKDGRILNVHKGYNDEALEPLMAEINAAMSKP